MRNGSGSIVTSGLARAERPLPVLNAFDRTLLKFFVGIAACLFVAFPATRLRLATHGVSVIVLILLGLAAVSVVYARLRPCQRLRDTSAMLFWSTATTNVGFLVLYPFARGAAPLADPSLASIDRTLGMDVSALAGAVASTPWLHAASSRVYDSLVLLILCAAVLPPVLLRREQSEKQVLATWMAIVMAAGFVSFAPAIGPWVGGGTWVAPDHLACTASVRALQSDAVFAVDLSHPDAFVALPSFHVVLALVSGFCLWPLPYVGKPAMAWALAICASTLLCGWHYGVDVVVGTTIAAVAYGIARYVTRTRAQGETRSRYVVTAA